MFFSFYPPPLDFVKETWLESNRVRFIFPYSPRGVRAAKQQYTLRIPAHKKTALSFLLAVFPTFVT